MTKWRQPELEAILGDSLDDLTLESIQRLVRESVSESEILDFKKSLWPSNGPGSALWSPEQEFGKDVAALANLRGGLLLVGVKDVDGTAVDAPGLDLASTPEREERRLRQALVNHVSPVPRCEFIWVKGDGDRWFLGLAVPPTSRSPHAVLGERGDSRLSLHYPLRHGLDTIWLSEPEVAERYSRRVEARSTETVRLRSAVRTGVEALTQSSASGVWLYVAIVPESPVDGRLDASTVQQVDDWHRSSGIESPLGRALGAFGRGIVAPERIVFTGSRHSVADDETEIRDALIELYVDGRAFAAAPIALRTTGIDTDRQVGEITLVDDGVLLVDVCVRWCAHQAGAWGLGRVSMGFADADSSDGSLESPIELVESDTGNVRRIRPSRQIRGEIRAETVADLAAAGSVQQRLAVLHQSLARLLHWFGLAEPKQLRPDGTIVPRQFTMPRYREVEAWAEKYEVNAELLEQR